LLGWAGQVARKGEGRGMYRDFRHVEGGGTAVCVMEILGANEQNWVS
jgi:hypothetical protein